MNVSRAAFILGSLFLSSSSYAFDPPKVVYRVSSRAPADVFSSGFPAAGNDIDLMRYVSGTSVVDGTSTYISTTEIPRDALAIAAVFAQAYPSIPVYIYLVRPTENFYSVAASLRFAQDALPSPEVREQAIAISLATQGQENGHWAARGGITSEQILGVRRFFYNDGYPVLRDLIRNNNYLYIPATISHLPMPAHNAKVVAAYVAEKTLGAGFMFAATVNMGCDQQARQCRKAFASHCLAVKPISFKTLLSTTVAEMISAGILINSTSRQLWSEPVHDGL